jgi:NADPH:quinone reductase-like Zn-dependent oxidoreductase
MSNKRVIISAFGGPEVLQIIEDAQLPSPKPGEVRIKVEASSICMTDIAIRMGFYPVSAKPPFTPGYALVGVIDAVGSRVTNLSIGQRVSALTVIGGNAEYVCHPAIKVIPTPSSIDPAEAVYLVLSGMTAYQMFHRLAHVTSGQRILVQGGSGAIGSALLQLGRHVGATMVATASPTKLEGIRSLGATAIDYQAPDYLEQIRMVMGDGYDVIFDAIGLQGIRDFSPFLSKQGTFVSYGMMASFSDIKKRTFINFLRIMNRYFAQMRAISHLNRSSKQRTAVFYDITRLRHSHPDWYAADLNDLHELLQAHIICPCTAEKLSLDQARYAHQMLEQRRVQGQLIFTL